MTTSHVEKALEREDVERAAAEETRASEPPRDPGAPVAEVLAEVYAEPEPEALSPETLHFVDQAATLRAEHADFDEVVNQPVFTDALRDAIIESPRGPAIAYVLGKNLSEAMRLGDLPAEQMREELNELAAMAPYLLDAETTARVAGVPDAERDDSTCSMSEYMKREARRVAARLPWER